MMAGRVAVLEKLSVTRSAALAAQGVDIRERLRDEYRYVASQYARQGWLDRTREALRASLRCGFQLKTVLYLLLTGLGRRPLLALLKLRRPAHHKRG
jgi:hypothetical protein